MKRLVISLLGLLLTPALAAAPTEYEVKAAFLYNFAKFTEWPAATADNSLNLCLLGNGGYEKALRSLEGKAVRDQTISVQVLGSLPVPDNCQILFITASKASMLDDLTESLATHTGMLSVSDIEGFANSGGVIEFRLIDNKLRFAINLQAARALNLDLSSKLLRLAVSVKE